MKAVPYYSASADVARATGTIATTYRTKDGRFILSGKEVNTVLMRQPGRTLADLDVIEISVRQAKTLIARGGYKMGEEQ